MLLHPDRGFMPIWDRAPQTSSMWLARLMTGRNGHDGCGSFIKGQPYNKQELHDYFERAWAEISRRQAAMKPQMSPPLVDPIPAPVVTRRVRETPQQSADVDKCAYTSKIKHASKLWALNHKIKLMHAPDETQPELLEVYRCKWCGGWHVGHRSAA